jgi:hypothetical protein
MMKEKPEMGEVDTKLNLVRRALGTERHGIPKFREGMSITTVSVVSDIDGQLWRIDPETGTIRELSRYYRKWGDEPEVIRVYETDFTEMRVEAVKPASET